MPCSLASQEVAAITRFCVELNGSEAVVHFYQMVHCGFHAFIHLFMHSFIASQCESAQLGLTPPLPHSPPPPPPF